MLRSSNFTLTAIVALLCLAAASPLQDSFAQQRNPAASTSLQIDLPDVVAEVRAAFDRYNDAINSGNIAVQNDTFWNDDRTIRYGIAENQYGYKEIAAFRANARPLDPPRTLSRIVITTYGRDFAVASTLVNNAKRPGKVSRQMQTWVRFPEGWRVVAAQVSAIDDPTTTKP